MHEAFDYLKKRVDGFAKEADAVFDEMSRQVEREMKTLEEVEHGREFDEGRALVVKLELPDRTVEMQATTAHYVRLDSGGQVTHYLIGLRITSMSDEHRALYNAYLDELNKSGA